MVPKAFPRDISRRIRKFDKLRPLFHVQALEYRRRQRLFGGLRRCLLYSGPLCCPTCLRAYVLLRPLQVSNPFLQCRRSSTRVSRGVLGIPLLAVPPASACLIQPAGIRFLVRVQARARILAQPTSLTHGGIPTKCSARTGGPCFAQTSQMDKAFDIPPCPLLPLFVKRDCESRASCSPAPLGVRKYILTSSAGQEHSSFRTFLGLFCSTRLLTPSSVHRPRWSTPATRARDSHKSSASAHRIHPHPCSRYFSSHNPALA